MKRFKDPSEIKVGVVGYGGAFNMGRSHLQQMQAAGMTPVAVCDTDAGRLEVAEQDFPGIETYTEVADMLKKSPVNLVVIITPHNTHAKIAVQCLNAKRHVVCEKPLAITTAECDRMIAAAKKNNLVLSTYHNRHWDGCILEAVERVKTQKIVGDVLRIEAHMGGYGKPGDWWRTSKTISGGILYDWGVHLLEYSLQLLDGNMTEVAGYATQGFWGPYTAWKDDANEDEGYAIVRFDNGKRLTLCITSIDSKPKEGIVEVTGTKGTYFFDHTNWTAVCHQDGEKVVRTGRNRAGENHKYYQNVADHLVKGEKLIITPEWSRRPIHILDLADQSAKKGRALVAKYE